MNVRLRRGFAHQRIRSRLVHLTIWVCVVVVIAKSWPFVMETVRV